MLPALADTTDIATRYPDLTLDANQATALINDASAIVRAYAGRDWTDDIGQLEDVPDGVVGIVAAMVARALLNPGGVTWETTGPFNVSYGPSAADRLFLTKHEKMLLRDGRQAFTVTPYLAVPYTSEDLVL